MKELQRHNGLRRFRRMVWYRTDLQPPNRNMAARVRNQKELNGFTHLPPVNTKFKVTRSKLKKVKYKQDELRCV